MSPKSERSDGEISSRDFPITSGDEWLKRKRQIDGAEGLWRIHDKIYDLTLWSRIHPGGRFWIDETRGTDVTEVFESHHFSEMPESLLQKYYLREAATPKSRSATFNENGFLGVFKRKVRQLQLVSSIGPSTRFLLLRDGLVAGVFVTAFLAARYSSVWPLICGVLLGMLTVSMHDFLHMKYDWRVNYLNLSLMSSREWRIRHVLSHHQFQGTFWDLETSTWEPFMKLFPAKNQNVLTKFLRQVLSLLMYATSAHIQFFKRFLDVFLSRKLGFEPEELVGMSLPAFMFIFGGPNLWNTFLVWNFIILTGSFVSCSFKSTPLPSSSRITWENSIRDKEDFGVTQLSLTGTHPRENLSNLSILNSYHANVLHYLCPAINCRRLGQLIPAFEDTCAQFGVAYTKNDTEVLLGLSGGSPKGHVFFS